MSETTKDKEQVSPLVISEGGLDSSPVMYHNPSGNVLKEIIGNNKSVTRFLKLVKVLDFDLFLPAADFMSFINFGQTSVPHGQNEAPIVQIALKTGDFYTEAPYRSPSFYVSNAAVNDANFTVGATNLDFIDYNLEIRAYIYKLQLR